MCSHTSLGEILGWIMKQSPFVPQKSSFQTDFSVLENIYQIQSHLAVVQNKLYTFHGILLIVLKNMCRDGVSTLQ